MADDIQDDEVVENNKKNKQDNAPFNENDFIKQIEAEKTKKRREALKGKVSGLMDKLNEAERSVKIIEKQIQEEINLFKEGL